MFTVPTPLHSSFRLLVCVGLIGCASGAGNADRSIDGAGAAGSGGSGGGGLFDNPAGDPPAPPPVVGTPTTIGEGEECNADSYVAEGRQLDIYMIVDDSGSMVPWWPGTLEAINMFVNDPGSAGIGVGVQFFGSECSVDYYATPRVPIAPLPGNTAAIERAFPILPIEGTATVPAMQGAVRHAREWTMSHPDSKTVVLLVTDGLPDDCGSSVQGVVDTLAQGLNGTPSIQTFVVGIGFGLNALNQFAMAGGTGQALLVSPGAAGELLTALNDIRGAALPCDYKIPDGAEGDIANDTINVRYTAPGGERRLIGYVPDAASCDPQQGGWYYDDLNAPTRVVACPTTCNTLSEGGEVQVVLGCPRVNVVPI